MARVPLLDSGADLDAAGRDALAWITRSRGELTRPFAVLLHHPDLARKVAELGAMVRFAGDLRPDQRELAILATSRAHDCAFEWASHRDIAVEAGVSPTAVNALQADAGLEAFTDEEAALVAFTRAFVHASTVDETTFARAHTLLGTRGVVELAVVIGYYSMLACVLNACAPGLD